MLQLRGYIYWCSVKDDSLAPWTVYVGLYNNGKGILFAETIKKGINSFLIQEMCHCWVVWLSVDPH